MPDHDILCAGFPSQSFSVDGERPSWLLFAIREVQGKVISSGYDNDPYDQLLPGWTRSEFDAAARAGKKAANGKLPRRTEVLWMNYAPPVGVAA